MAAIRSLRIGFLHINAIPSEIPRSVSAQARMTF